MLGTACVDLGRLHDIKARQDSTREGIFKAIDSFELCESDTRLRQAKEALASLG